MMEILGCVEWRYFIKASLNESSMLNCNQACLHIVLS